MKPPCFQAIQFLSPAVYKWEMANKKMNRDRRDAFCHSLGVSAAAWDRANCNHSDWPRGTNKTAVRRAWELFSCASRLHWRPTTCFRLNSNFLLLIQIFQAGSISHSLCINYTPNNDHFSKNGHCGEDGRAYEGEGSVGRGRKHTGKIAGQVCFGFVIVLKTQLPLEIAILLWLVEPYTW